KRNCVDPVAPGSCVPTGIVIEAAGAPPETLTCQPLPALTFAFWIVTVESNWVPSIMHVTVVDPLMARPGCSGRHCMLMSVDTGSPIALRGTTKKFASFVGLPPKFKVTVLETVVAFGSGRRYTS